MAELVTGFWGLAFVGFLMLSKWVDSYEFEDIIFNKSEGPFFYRTSSAGDAISPTSLMIGLTLIPGAAARGAGNTHTHCCLCSYYVYELVIIVCWDNFSFDLCMFYVIDLPRFFCCCRTQG